GGVPVRRTDADGGADAAPAAASGPGLPLSGSGGSSVGRPRPHPVGRVRGLNGYEGRTGPESFRGPVVAWVSSPRVLGDAGVWLPDAGTTPREGGPGVAGDQKRATTADHCAGDPPRLAALPDAA